MSERVEVKGFLSNLFASAAWDAIKQLWGPAVLAFIVALWQKLNHGSLDWLAIGGIFLVASILAFLNFRKREPRIASPSELSDATGQTDGQTATEPRVKIHRATFGAGPNAEMSVTDKLHNAPREGLVVHLDGTLGNLLPRDPAFNVRKRLDVDYSYESDTVIHLSRLEPPLGETMRLVLPEDTEVQRLEKETQGCAELKEIAKQDAEKMGERLHVCGKRADFYYQPAFDPYIDMFIELVNSSVFEIVTFGELVGHARYANNPLSSPPRIEAHSRFDVGPPLVTVKHGAKATLIIRQPLSRGIADLMVAQQSKGIPLRFDGVAVSFKRLGILGVQTFGWYGIPEITIEEARRI